MPGEVIIRVDVDQIVEDLSRQREGSVPRPVVVVTMMVAGPVVISVVVVPVVAAVIVAVVTAVTIVMVSVVTVPVAMVAAAVAVVVAVAIAMVPIGTVAIATVAITSVALVAVTITSVSLGLVRAGLAFAVFTLASPPVVPVARAVGEQGCGGEAEDGGQQDGEDVGAASSPGPHQGLRRLLRGVGTFCFLNHSSYLRPSFEQGLCQTVSGTFVSLLEVSKDAFGVVWFQWFGGAAGEEFRSAKDVFCPFGTS